jgi:hypothetical protein
VKRQDHRGAKETAQKAEDFNRRENKPEGLEAE